MACTTSGSGQHGGGSGSEMTLLNSLLFNPIQDHYNDFHEVENIEEIAHIFFTTHPSSLVDR